MKIMAGNSNLPLARAIAAYLELPPSPIALALDAERERPDAGWRFTHLRWDDGAALRAEGAVALGADASLRAMDLRLHSDNAALLPPRYLSGWLGVAGLPGLALAGTVDAHVRMVDGALAGIDAGLRGVDISDGRGRFAFAGLDGDLRISEGAPVDSALSWRGGRLQALDFGPATLPFRSVAGRLDLREDVAVGMLDGQLRFSGLSLLLPEQGQGMRIESGLAVEALRLDELASAFGWPVTCTTLTRSAVSNCARGSDMTVGPWSSRADGPSRKVNTTLSDRRWRRATPSPE